MAGDSGNVPNAPHMSSQFAVYIFWWEGAFGMAGYGVPHQRGTERELEGYMFCCLVVIQLQYAAQTSQTNTPFTM